MSEILLQISNTCLFDEPFLRNRISGIEVMPDESLQKFNEINDLDFYFFQAIPPKAHWPQAKNTIEKLLKGELVSIGLYNDYGLPRIKDAETFIIKMNYASLLASWMQTNFDLSSIVLMRNPLAVLASSIRHEWIAKMQVNKNQYFPKFKFSDTLQKYFHIYEKYVLTREDLLVFLWAINIKEGLLKMDPQKTLFLFYEHLLIDFEKEMRRIFDYLHLPFEDEVLKLRFNPSKSSKDYAFNNIRTENQLNQWKYVLDKQQILSARKIVEQFEIDFYLEDIPEMDLFRKKLMENSPS